MRTIGLLGGMTWLSTLEYYKIINEAVNRELGGVHSARCVLYSFDFNDVILDHNHENLDNSSQRLIDGALKLKSAGADFLVICTNAMHIRAESIENAVGIPLLHIVDVVANAIRAKKMRRVGLLGNRITMEAGFYKERLFTNHGIETIVPPEKDRLLIHRIVNEELNVGLFLPSAKQFFKESIAELRKKGAEGVILGCTEISHFVKHEDSKITLFDSASIHASAAAALALTPCAIVPELC